MSRVRVGILVLAAGEARRFGSPKLLAPFDGVALIRHALVAALGASSNVMVVTGATQRLIEAQISGLPVSCVYNAEWADGMGSSIACGVKALAGFETPQDAVIVALADQPRIRSADFMQLIEAHERRPDRIVAARYADVLGPPVLFPRRYFAELGDLRGPRGARVLIERHSGQIESISVPAAAIDVDTTDDYQRLTDFRT